MKDYTHKRLRFAPSLIEEVIAEWKEQHDPAFYDITTLRERMSPPLSKTRTYHLRKPDMAGTPITQLESTRDIMTMVDTPVYDRFPVMWSFVNLVGDVMFQGWSQLGRVFITQLAGGESIGRHVDEGAYFDRLHRFHLVLQSQGSMFCWDNEEVEIHQGECWMINNSIPHWVRNLTSEPRTHLIFDGA